MAAPAPVGPEMSDELARDIAGTEADRRAAWWARALVDRASFEAACGEGVRPGAAAYVLGGRELLVPDGDSSLVPHLRRDGFWESWVSLAIARAVQPGWHCLDVGAHLGYYTLLMGERASPGGGVLAIEPQLALADLLRWSIIRNRLAALVAERAAGRRFDVASLWKYASMTGSASLHPAVGYESDAREQVVVETIDAMVRVANLEPIDLAKIDAEGAEPDVWAGMEDTRERSPGLIVVMEVASNRHYDLAQFLRTIEADGFPLALIEGDGTVQDTSLDVVVERGAELPMLWLQR